MVFGVFFDQLVNELRLLKTLSLNYHQGDYRTPPVYEGFMEVESY